jgi:hypothetical protein
MGSMSITFGEADIPTSPRVPLASSSSPCGRVAVLESVAGGRVTTLPSAASGGVAVLASSTNGCAAPLGSGDLVREGEAYIQAKHKQHGDNELKTSSVQDFTS